MRKLVSSSLSRCTCMLSIHLNGKLNTNNRTGNVSDYVLFGVFSEACSKH